MHVDVEPDDSHLARKIEDIHDPSVSKRKESTFKPSYASCNFFYSRVLPTFPVVAPAFMLLTPVSSSQTYPMCGLHKRDLMALGTVNTTPRVKTLDHGLTAAHAR
jgi:hypothetical protein